MMNGTHLIVMQLKTHVVVLQIANEPNKGELDFIGVPQLQALTTRKHELCPVDDGAIPTTGCFQLCSYDSALNTEE